MAKGKKLARGSDSDSEDWEEAEKSLEELVNSRRLEVERLERELDFFKKIYADLLESLSSPTFPTLPFAGRDKGSKKRDSKRSQLRGKAKSTNRGEIIRNEATVAEKATSKVKPIASKLPPSSKPASFIVKAIELIDLSDDDEVDNLKDKIRRARPSKSKTTR